MHAEFKHLRAEMRDLRTELIAAMKAEGETTRRHFDVVAEQFTDFRNCLPTASLETPSGLITTSSESPSSKALVPDSGQPTAHRRSPPSRRNIVNSQVFDRSS